MIGLVIVGFFIVPALFVWWLLEMGREDVYGDGSDSDSYDPIG